MPTSAKSIRLKPFYNKSRQEDDHREIECPETLITYENNIDPNDDEENPVNQQKLNNFFNSADNHNVHIENDFMF